MTRSFEDTTLLIGLGAARTGTLWLSNYFSSHPEILMSPIRVLHYFDAHYDPRRYGRYDRQFEARLRQKAEKRAHKKPSEADVAALESFETLRDRVRMITEEGAYIDYFHKRWQGETVFADITPSYCFLEPAAFAGMAKTHGRVRFLFVMRNPIDRFWSGLRLRRTNDPQVDVYQVIDKWLRPRKPMQDRDYKTTMVNLDSVVPAEAVKYIFFENLFDMESIAGLCQFAGVSTSPAKVDAAMNQSESMPLDAERRRLAYRRFEPTYRYLFERYDGRLPQSWLDDMERFST